jgi:hypothetical protein
MSKRAHAGRELVSEYGTASGLWRPIVVDRLALALETIVLRCSPPLRVFVFWTVLLEELVVFVNTRHEPAMA